MLTELRTERPDLRRVPLYGVVKEVAPTSQAKTDAKLGVAEFEEKYFGGNQLYLDEKKVFYDSLGGKWLSLPSWNPFSLWEGYKKLNKRIKSTGIEGNLVGEGLVKGGVLVFGAGDKGILHQHEESTGQDPAKWIPAIKDALLRFPSE
mmetsp:Transcript_35895/g.78611  ORF Transcript_35895/g.78611 Transcript_35895/m.78611 type:complete len:148 (+) Transcript_35895:402-845(+)